MINFGDEHGILKPSGNGSAADLPQLGETHLARAGALRPDRQSARRVRRGARRVGAGVVEALWPVDTRGCMI